MNIQELINHRSKWYKVKQVAEKLGMGSTTFFRWLKTQKLIYDSSNASKHMVDNNYMRYKDSTIRTGQIVRSIEISSAGLEYIKDIYAGQINAENEHNKQIEEVKSKARSLVAQALLSGEIIKPKHCTACELAPAEEAHHSNYLKPLEVDWLCCKCHTRFHKLASKVGDYRYIIRLAAKKDVDVLAKLKKVQDRINGVYKC
jgi:hypothetical protein